MSSAQPSAPLPKKYSCESHQKPFESLCLTCASFLCIECLSNHSIHEIETLEKFNKILDIIVFEEAKDIYLAEDRWNSDAIEYRDEVKKGKEIVLAKGKAILIHIQGLIKQQMETFHGEIKEATGIVYAKKEELIKRKKEILARQQRLVEFAKAQKTMDVKSVLAMRNALTSQEKNQKWPACKPNWNFSKADSLLSVEDYRKFQEQLDLSQKKARDLLEMVKKNENAINDVADKIFDKLKGKPAAIASYCRSCGKDLRGCIVHICPSCSEDNNNRYELCEQCVKEVLVAFA